MAKDANYSELLTTSDVARALDMSADNVRRLERNGVLRARRTASGVRIYDPEDVEREVERRRIRRARP